MSIKTMTTVLLVSFLVACGSQVDPQSEPVDPRAIVTPPPGVSDDVDTELHLVRGMQGLIEHGDELMVMVYGEGAREAAIRAHNIVAGQSSLERWIAMDKDGQTVLDDRFLRVPDLDDETGSRFYYYERGADRAWKFRAICSGAWDDDPEWPSICDLTHQVGQKIVSIELAEPIFLRHYDEIVERVMKALRGSGIIK